ncbi:hypothetical protein GCM10028862_01390 [Luteimonas pelagia]
MFARVAAGAAFVVVSAFAYAQDRAGRLFDDPGVLDVRIAVPWSELRRDTAQVRRHPTVLAYRDAAGNERRIEGTVEARGISRRRMCRFPPFRLRFDDAAIAGTLFEGAGSLKVVTHCENGRRWSAYPVLEFLAYRIYNLVTPHAFRVRPLAVRYGGGDADGDGPRFAFLIEDVDDVARRNGRRRLETGAFAARDYDAAQMGRFMLFQLLIGNTDWEILGAPTDITCCHNVRVTAGDSPPGLVALPYDFDVSGFVDAHYAVPDARLPIEDVTERLFRGFCVHDPAIDGMRAEFLSRRGAILALVEGEQRLEPRRRREALRYLEGFFDTLADDARYARQVRASCRR